MKKASHSHAMPFGNSRSFVPKGQNENSPAFQRRVGGLKVSSPEGTVESGSSASLFQPSLRDWFDVYPRPGVETPGYFRKVPTGLLCDAKTVNFLLALHLGRRMIVSSLLAIFVLAGCASIPTPGHLTEARYQPANIYRKETSLPARIKRVAVLPLAAGDSPMLGAGVDSLQSILRSELLKSKRFELTPVSPEQLRQLTGQQTWRPDEKLPADFFDRLNEATGCDAVLFCQLTHYQPYQPLAIGWKFALVENTGSQIYWSADEVFDAGDPRVACAARSYYGQTIRAEKVMSDDSLGLLPPRRFGQFSLNALLATLPAR
jgi:hypothetical protein